MSISWLFTNNLFCALLLAFHGTCQTDKSQNKAGENARSLVVWFKILATLSHSKCEIGWGSSQAEKGFMINVKLAPKKSWWLWPKKSNAIPFNPQKTSNEEVNKKSEYLSSSQWISWRNGEKKIYFLYYILCGAFNKRTVKFFGFTKDFGIRKNSALWSLLLCHPVNFLCEPLERSGRRECPQCYLTVVHKLLPLFSGHKPRNPET